MKATSFVGLCVLCGVLGWWLWGERLATAPLPVDAASPLRDAVNEVEQGAAAPSSPRIRPTQGSSLVMFDLVDAQSVPDGAVSEIVARLLPAAQSGDIEAMRQLYLSLQRCRTWPASLAAEPLVVDPQYLARSGLTEIEVRESRVRSQREAELQKATDCKDVTSAQVQTAGSWLRRAAEAGDPYARLAYVDAVDEIVGDQRQMLAHPEAVAQFRNDAIGYLQDLAQRGMPEAMLRLSSAYASGVLADRNLTLAYGYGKAAEQLMGGPEPAFLDTYRQGLSADELRNAQALSRSLVMALR